MPPSIRRVSASAPLFALLAASCALTVDADPEPDSLEVVQQPLLTPSPNPNPPAEWGRPGWSPHAIGSYRLLPWKRVTWTIAKNYADDGSYIPGRGTRYAKRGSNDFIANEFKKALISWATTADVEFPFIVSGSPDITFQVVPYMAPSQNLPPQPGDAGKWKPSDGSLSFSENYADFTSLGNEAPPPGYTGDSMAPAYRGTVHKGNGWLYATALHEAGHMLGLAHAWEDTWDYAFAEGDMNPRACTGLCRYPFLNVATDFSIMDYRNGDHGGRHPRSRVLTQYDVDYAQGMYGTSQYVPLVETQSPDGYDYVNNWDKVSRTLDWHSYINNPLSLEGRESSAFVNNLMGGVLRSGTPSATWARLYAYLGPAGTKTVGTDTQMPPEHYFWETLGLVRTSSGGGFTTPLYRHRNASAGIRRVTTSATPPAGFVQELLIGYIQPTPGLTTDNTFQPLDDTSSYQIISRSTGKQLGTPAERAPEGTSVVNNPPSPSISRNWRFFSAGEGYYRLKIWDSIDENGLTVAGASTADGAVLQKWAYKGLPHQLWRVESLGGGYYRAIARHSGKCLEVPGTADGAQLVQRGCTGATNQQFRVVKKSQFFDRPGFYKIIARHSGKAIEVAGSSTADRALVQQRTFNNGANQRWSISAFAEGIIAAKHSGKALEIRDGSQSNGAVADQINLNANPLQTWSLRINASGYFQLVNSLTSKCLDVATSSAADGAKVQQWACGTGNNQQFDVVRIE